MIDLTEKDEHSPISEDSDPEELPAISFDTTGLSTSRKDEKIDPTTTKHVIRLHQRRVITSEDNEDMQGVHLYTPDSQVHHACSTFSTTKGV